jgi:hypothetical protein
VVRKFEADQLVGAAEIAERLGVARQVVHQWRSRHPGFPAPVASLRQALIWYWPDVETWAVASGRLPDSKGSATRRRRTRS